MEAEARPILISRDDRLEVVLSRDAGKPEATRPVLVFRVPRRREQRALGLVHDALMGLTGEGNTEADADAVMEDMLAQLAGLLDGWSNLRGPDGAALAFNTKDLDLALDDVSIIEAFKIVHDARFITMGQKKSCASPSGSSSGPSTGALAAGLPGEAKAIRNGSGVLDATGETTAGSGGSPGLAGFPSCDGATGPMTPGPLQRDVMENGCG